MNPISGLPTLFKRCLPVAMPVDRFCLSWAILFGALSILWATTPLWATDVAFWHEYRPTEHDAEQTCLLLQFSDLPPATTGSIERVESVGNPVLQADGRFEKALKLDGRSALRCVPTGVFDGGQVSIEAWVRLDRYPKQEGCLVFRPACVDAHATYDPQVDRSKGFSLSVDAKGALHLDTVNTFYGQRTRTSTQPGAVPLERWVHLAGICGPGRRLFVDGRELVNQPINWGQGLTVQGEQELQPQPFYIGNNDQGSAGITGLLDQVRVHRNVLKFWPPEDDGWTDPQSSEPILDSPDCFVAEHAPVVYLPLDGTAAASEASSAVEVEVGGTDFRSGVRGQALAGQITVTGANLFRSEEGSLEFWLRPLGVNNLSDKNWSFVNEPFIFYLFNGGEHQPTLYFRLKDGGLHFVHAPMEIHPARWFHFLFTWRGTDIRIYADGKLAGQTTANPLAPDGRSSADRFTLNSGDNPSLLDEIRIYDRALLPVEAANAFWRYRDPARVVSEVQLPSVEFVGEYLPSRQTIHYRLLPFGSTDEFARLRMDLRTNGKIVKTWERPWSETRTGELKLPPLGDGEHSIATSVADKKGERIPGVEFRFFARRFPWEGNRLGLTDEVFAPFTPLKVHDSSVSVVSRSMTMNGFGLWDEVVSLGRNLLAAPMAIRYETESGEGSWDHAAGTFASAKPKQAVFEGAAEAGPVSLRSRSTTEIDGCMKVELTMAPGRAPAEVRKLWIEIPLKDAEMPLMHSIGDGLRHNHSGAVPAGQGAVWDGSQAARSQPWRNAFVPYLWLGAAERGVAFFAENDRGWVTEKDKSETPTHQLLRQGDRLILRVYLINHPVTLTEPRRLVFGLQASPTKPMPSDWRKRLPHAPGGLAVVPWGGIQCASQGPLGDDWTIVDKIVEVRRGQQLDSAWLSDYVRRHQPPKIHNEADWTYYQNHFAQRAKDVGLTRPLAVYQEEMRAAHSRPEWIVYQDEWKTGDGPAARTDHRGLDLRGGHRSFSGISEINFVRSYADFGTWMANQWLQRGVSLYWDNTYLYPSYNTRTTAAYLAEDGYVQPALTIWNVREYHQRVWHLLQEWRRRRDEPLEWTLHMTNTEPLPVQTWGTVQLDHELSAKQPFSPEWLMTETIGRQVGNLPLSLYEVYGRDNEVVVGLPKDRRERIEWGLRAVHEIQRSGPLEQLLADFGYAEDDVTVHNYWSDRPVLTVTPATVKWLALSKPEAREMLILLASWSQDTVTADVRIDLPSAGLTAVAPLQVVDAETRNPVAPAATQTYSVRLPGPYGNRLLHVTP